MRILASSIMFAAVALSTTGCATAKAPAQPMTTVPHVDLPRYMGDWYVIANIPYFAEKNCVDSVESYALRPDGDIDNWFTCRKKTFDAPMKRKANALATVEDKTSDSVWRVKFFKVISVKYLILDVGPHYEWAMVGHPSRDYGWILSRKPTMSDAMYDNLLKRFAAQGYDTSKFSKVPQQASQPLLPTGSPGTRAH